MIIVPKRMKANTLEIYIFFKLKNKEKIILISAVTHPPIDIFKSSYNNENIPPTTGRIRKNTLTNNE